jgi:uncharacterized damage-inducible protein DinB
MPESDPLQILLSHDRWATAQVLTACEELTPEQFHRRFDIGPGTLHDTLTHVLGVMRTWTDTLAETALRPRLESDGQRRTPGQLRALLDDVWRELAAEARRRPVSEIVIRHLRDGTQRPITRGAALAQVATHSMHHRAQCLNMLRHLGATPLPPSSVAEWAWMGEGQA